MRERGQTTLDFSFGISLFLIAITFVVVFIPTIIAPFTGGSQSDIITANRIVNSLGEEILLEEESENYYALDRECTVTFFKKLNGESISNPPSNCNFAPSSISSLRDVVGLSERVDYNITIEEISQNGTIVGIDGQKLKAESSSSFGREVTVTKRIISLTTKTGKRESYKLIVRVW